MSTASFRRRCNAAPPASTAARGRCGPSVWISMAAASLLCTATHAQTTRYAAPRGEERGSCTEVSRPCSLPAAVDAARSGDVIELLEGTYTISAPINPPSGRVVGPDTLRTVVRAQPGALVVVNGLNIDLVGSWSRVPGASYVYRIDWQPSWTVAVPKPDRIKKGETAAYRELVVVEHDPEPYTFSRETDPRSLEEGEIFVEDDDALHRSPTALYIRLRGDGDPNDVQMRMSSLWGLVNTDNSNGFCPASFIHVAGITFRYAASYLNAGLVCTAPGKGGGSIVVNTVVEWGNGFGIMITGDDNVIRRNIVRNNGRGDLRTYRTNRSLIERNVTGGGNWKGYFIRHDAGNKILRSSGNTFRYNTFGPSRYEVDGLWLDEDSRHNRIYGNRVDSVLRAGIFLENGSDSNYVFANVITRVRPQRGSFEGFGILVRDSAGNLIAYNTLWGNGGCIRYHRAKENRHPVRGNLHVNNACLAGGERTGPQVDWEDAVPGPSDRSLASNRSDGNIYWPSPDGIYFRFRESGRQSAFPATSKHLLAWSSERGFDRESRLIDTSRPHVLSLADPAEGWRLPVDSQLIGKAIAIPDTSWWDVTIPLVDMLGQPRPSSGGDLGAHQRTAAGNRR